MKRITQILFYLISTFIISSSSFNNPNSQAENTNPPDTAVRLIFIHHSTGENWLNDENGGLAKALQENNYFPSDTNYGWGPDAIGDRTDIPNWMEWFRGSNTDRIMQAVYNEGEVHSPYNRTLNDPGGENQIILFKSCFPNSALEGSPTDPPSAGNNLTVGNAKYTYNEILKYFRTRPDKLFVVITAPPLTDPTLAANARAFNQWLVNDWLRENSYSVPNVAVFDFYNILTSPDNHHRIINGGIEHVIQDNRNTEYYPSEDDHPSRQGNQKATQEFLPMLNSFYQRWKTSSPQSLSPQSQDSNPTAEVVQNAPSPQTGMTGVVLSDFETDQPVWEGSVDEAVQSSISCQVEAGNAASGERSLRVEFNVLANSWATCSSFFDSPRNLSAAEGIHLKMLVEDPGNTIHLDVFTGTDDQRATYAKELVIPEPSGKWTTVQVKWDEFKRVEWETDGGSIFNHPDQITGLAFGFPSGDQANKGLIWVDDITVISTDKTSVQPATKQEPPAENSAEGVESEQQEQPAEKSSGLRSFLPFCGSIVLLPLGLLIFSNKFTRGIIIE